MLLEMAGATGKRRHLGKEESDRVRVILEGLIKEHGTQTRVKELTGLSQQQISLIMGGAAVGHSSLRRIAEFLKVPPPELLYGKSIGTLLGAIDGWESAAEQVRQEKPYLTTALDRVAQMRIPDAPSAITKEMAMRFAMAWFEVMPQSGSTH